MLEWLIVLSSLCLTLGIAAWVCESPGLRKLVVEIQMWWLDMKRESDEEEESARMVSLSQWSNTPPQGRQRKSFHQ
jgi:hypothetical protein